MDSFAAVIRRWPTVEDFAADIGRKPNTVASWRQRDSIPGDAFAAIVAAAVVRGFEGITYELLARLAARRRSAA